MSTQVSDREPVALPIHDQQEVKRIYEAMCKGNAKLVGPNGEARRLPDSLSEFLIELSGLLNEGDSVYLLKNEAKLTTIEAAALLGVSRQYFVNLLNRHEIPFHMVGTHRRVYVQDLLHYKTKRDLRRKKAINDLAEAEAEAAEGVYGIVTPENAECDRADP